MLTRDQSAMNDREPQWFANLDAPKKWSVAQLKVFLKRVAPDQFKALKDKRKRVGIEALALRVVANHKPSREFTKRTEKPIKVTWMHGHNSTAAHA